MKAIRKVHEGIVLAQWDAESGFSHDETAWRQVVIASGENLRDDVIEDYMPPHIILRNLHGDIVQVFTQHGTLRAPQSDDYQDWIAKAAKVLVDAPHLDLISQYLFKYVYDSPDPTRPFLVGNKENRGDIHQTTRQTLSTAAGGICRGDCDDLSELIQDILAQQDKLAYVISLPAHAAVAWVEERPEAAEDQRWHAFVMQTGPSLQFSAATVPEALQKAYGYFDAGDTFDANALGLLLRFSGENTRSSWRLSHRIFTEPDYARTMIDVQRDWHYQTYLQAINKMQSLIDQGDHDTANYRELAGLYSFTGQHDLAVRDLREAIDRTTEPEARLYLRVELVGHLLDAQRVPEAVLEIEDMLVNGVPEAGEDIGQAMTSFGLQLAGASNPRHLRLESTRVLHQLCAQQMAEWVGKIRAWFASEQFNLETWQQHGQFRYIRRQLGWFTRSVTANVRYADGQVRSTDPSLRQLMEITEHYLTNMAFAHLDDRTDILGQYAVAGSFYEAVIGTEAFDQMLKQTPVLELSAQEVASFNHGRRQGGLSQMTIDLPWVRMSPSYWMSRITDFGDRDAAQPTPTQARWLLAQLDQAMETANDYDLLSAWHHRRAVLCRMILAMVLQDTELLRQQLAAVTERDDKRLRDDAAMWMGEVARMTDVDWFRDEAITAWEDLVNYKAKWYWIAWRAAVMDAPEHAVITAERAAKAFADEPAFIEEARFMRELLTDNQNR